MITQNITKPYVQTCHPIKALHMHKSLAKSNIMYCRKCAQHIEHHNIVVQESCAIAKMTARCALYK